MFISIKLSSANLIHFFFKRPSIQQPDMTGIILAGDLWYPDLTGVELTGLVE